MIPRRALAFALLLLLLLDSHARAWDTQVTKPDSTWKSMYVHPGAQPKTGTSTGFNRNEHAEVTYVALTTLLDGYPYQDPFLVTDLNASLFREDLRLMGTEGDLVDTLLEERLLPPPHHFAGLSDFSWTMYDWINKNSLCVALPPNYPGSKGPLCHEFVGWMGALNSSHFGTQTARIYQRLHGIAVKLARRAAQLRQKLEKSPGALDAYADFVREAERMALAYEGYAQHHLEDRWSTGHMWERWNSSSIETAPHKDLLKNLEVGAATGLLHGSEAITGLPDPVSSPWLTTERRTGTVWGPGQTRAVAPVLWRHVPEKGEPGDFITGVGDERLVDLFDGTFGKQYPAAGNKDRPMDVKTQQKELLECLMTGWAEVIREFGSFEGGYGIHRAKFWRKVPDFKDLEHGCWDMFLTNESMRIGWKEVELGLNLSETSRLSSRQRDAQAGSGATRTAWTTVVWRLMIRGILDPYGVGLATGGIGGFGLIQPGNAYADPPEYLETDAMTDPKSSGLPDQDPEGLGRDKQTVYGFFNRATTDWWCDGIADRLEKLRRSDDDVKAGGCRYLADRVYKGTDPTYQNEERKEIRTLDGKKGSPALEPICSHYGVKGKSYEERTPLYLHPGYVDEPYKRSKNELTAQSVANWCDQVPVLDLLRDEELRAQDVVARVTDLKAEIRLTGLNLGQKRGKFQILGVGSFFAHGGTKEFETPGFYSGVEFASWTPTSITFRLPEGREFPSRDYLVEVAHADGRESVGRFVLRIDAKKKEEDEEPEKSELPDPDRVEPPDENGRVNPDQCLARGEEFGKTCNEINERWARSDCEKSNHGFNCANWKVSCFSPYIPFQLFTQQACSTAGFFECVAGPYQAYLGCLESCNASNPVKPYVFEARLLCRNGDRNKNIQGCQGKLKAALEQCR
jgi:hypothetical protein